MVPTYGCVRDVASRTKRIHGVAYLDGDLGGEESQVVSSCGNEEMRI
jgi:hypothetical protein